MPSHGFFPNPKKDRSNCLSPQESYEACIFCVTQVHGQIASLGIFKTMPDKRLSNLKYQNRKITMKYTMHIHAPHSMNLFHFGHFASLVPPAGQNQNAAPRYNVFKFKKTKGAFCLASFAHVSSSLLSSFSSGFQEKDARKIWMEEMFLPNGTSSFPYSITFEETSTTHDAQHLNCQMCRKRSRIGGQRCKEGTKHN